MRRVITAVYVLLMATIWMGAAWWFSNQWPDSLLRWFNVIEVAVIGLSLAGSLTAIGFAQWRLACAFFLLLMLWSGLRIAGAPMSLIALPAITLALLPWFRERGFYGAGPAVTGGLVVLCSALWMRGGDTSAGIDVFLFEPLDLIFIEASLALVIVCLGGVAAGGRLLIRQEALDVGLAGALFAIIPLIMFPTLNPLALALLCASVLSLWTGLLLHAWRMAYIDELTRLPNRRALEERIQRLPREWAVAMLDIDHFKKFNDRWGHDVGDQVLRRVAAVLAGVGGGGQAYRYGGEEFTVIFAHANVERAGRAIEALREEVGRQPFRVRGERDGPERRGRGGGKDMQRITISAGLALATELAPEAAFDKADKALYRAKAAGRNRLIQA